MPLFRRRGADPATDQIRAAFARATTHVGEAQRAMLSAIPTARDDGQPLAVAIPAAVEALDQCAGEMAAWRDPKTEAIWQTCSGAIERAREEALVLSREGPMNFERLNARVGDVLHPLEEFVDAERLVRTL